MKFSLFILAMTSFLTFHAQKDVYVYFRPLYQTAAFGLDQEVQSENGDVFKLEHLKFYMSDIEIIHDGGQVIVFDSSNVRLVDITSSTVYLGQFPITNLEGIRFGVGVAPEINHLDISTYPETSPLSFQSPSMHWGWAAGYMHMIVGGQVDTNNDNIPDAGFELHNLGDANYHSKELMMPATQTGANEMLFIVDWNIDEWFNGIEPQFAGISHGELGINQTIMYNVVDSPVFAVPLAASISEEQTFHLSVYNGADQVVVKWPTSYFPKHAQLINADGRILMDQSINTSEIAIDKMNKGVFVLRLVDIDGDVKTQTIVIAD
ncbi:MAG: hypothetical protein IT221_10295 [Fluviicola sp.]|nr:hypothetical protein [Fluviicola sp.]